MSEETIQKSFPVEIPANLRISNIRGSVEIQAGEENEISITAVKHIDSGDEKRTAVEINQLEDGKVVVETRMLEGLLGFFNWSKPCKVTYTVRVPRQCSLHVSCVSSSAAIQGTVGSLRLSTVSGEVSLKGVSGDFDINLVSGDLEGEALSGALKIDTVSGDVRILTSSFSKANGSTVSGNIHLESLLGEGPYRFNSVSGDVQYLLPEVAGCNVNMKTISGKLLTQFPLTSSQRSGNHLHASVAGGGPTVTLSSVSGNLALATPGEAVPETEPPMEESQDNPATNPEPAQPKTSRQEILDRIANGEMTVEEALKALNS